MSDARVSTSVIGTQIDILTWERAMFLMTKWAKENKSRYVCICNVHSVVTARQDLSFALVVQEADLVTPDGAPIAWLMRRSGFANQQRINGPDLMWKYCEQAQHLGVSIYLYGGLPETLDVLQSKLKVSFPLLKIAGAYSPPFRELTGKEDAEVVDRINMSGAGIVWVSLGCPKQEKWMALHKGRINAVMVGVGAAFDYHAGTIKRAPIWMQHNGLEWLHRLCSEPTRLWRRYFITNTLFFFYIVQQIFRK